MEEVLLCTIRDNSYPDFPAEEVPGAVVSLPSPDFQMYSRHHRHQGKVAAAGPQLLLRAVDKISLHLDLRLTSSLRRPSCRAALEERRRLPWTRVPSGDACSAIPISGSTGTLSGSTLSSSEEGP